ncbi:MAG: DNA replication/repair protein RecF [Candidatus Nanopelagicales bacterium]
MWVKRLHLVDFRSYDEIDLALDPGAVVLLGPNGQGKTNIVEAIAYCAALDSHRVHGDAALVRSGAERAVIRMTVVVGDRETTVELQLNPGKSNRVQINGQPVTRNRDVVGTVRCSLFAPEHLRLVKGDPADRRRFLDSVMVQVAPRYIAVRADFERVLKQRNAALRSLASAPGSEAEAVLTAWDDRYVPIAAELTWGRINAVRQLADVVADSYRRISPAADQVEVEYESSVAESRRWDSKDVLAADLQQELAVRHRDEVRRGVTLVGPHRDDMALSLNGHADRGYASHGEAWSLALALQLASFHVLHRIADDPPVLVLDDVFAELDEKRRDRLLDAVADAEQVLVTAAVPADVPARLNAQIITVSKDSGLSQLFLMP